MINKVAEPEIRRGLTAAQAQELLAGQTGRLALCMGNIVVDGAVLRAGTIVNAERIDPVFYGQPISPVHPLLRAYELAEGLELLAARRKRWDGSRQPAQGQVFTLADEIERWYENWSPRFS